jgi:hypothetical protein
MTITDGWLGADTGVTVSNKRHQLQKRTIFSPVKIQYSFGEECTITERRSSIVYLECDASLPEPKMYP